MFPKNRQELFAQFRSPVYITHPDFPGISTFQCLNRWYKEVTIELAQIKCIIHSVDFLEHPNYSASPQTLRFQQDVFRLWYQIDGQGILQNVTRKSFGTARPGLLGVMDRGERHTYLHQKGRFSCFMMLFSLFPVSKAAKCFWNAGIEGKTVLDENERLIFENHIFSFFLMLSKDACIFNFIPLARLLELQDVLFRKHLILIEEKRFPENRGKSLVVKARNFIDANYGHVRHQRAIEDECGVDINYLNILFKKETGMTVYRYTTGVRMEHAKHLLETTSRSISDISARVGYPNANSFSRAFKHFEGMPPQEYRIVSSAGSTPRTSEQNEDN